MGMKIVDKLKNEDEDFVYLVKWPATLSYLVLKKIKQNLQSKDVLLYRNGDPLRDFEKDHFIGLVFENKEKIGIACGNNDEARN